jgi:hypothetical protein
MNNFYTFLGVKMQDILQKYSEILPDSVFSGVRDFSDGKLDEKSYVVTCLKAVDKFFVSDYKNLTGFNRHMLRWICSEKLDGLVKNARSGKLFFHALEQGYTDIVKKYVDKMKPIIKKLDQTSRMEKVFPVKNMEILEILEQIIEKEFLLEGCLVMDNVEGAEYVMKKYSLELNNKLFEKIVKKDAVEAFSLAEKTIQYSPGIFFLTALEKNSFKIAEKIFTDHPNISTEKLRISDLSLKALKFLVKKMGTSALTLGKIVSAIDYRTTNDDLEYIKYLSSLCTILDKNEPIPDHNTEKRLLLHPKKEYFFFRKSIKTNSIKVAKWYYQRLGLAQRNLAKSDACLVTSVAMAVYYGHKKIVNFMFKKYPEFLVFLSVPRDYTCSKKIKNWRKKIGFW